MAIIGFLVAAAVFPARAQSSPADSQPSAPGAAIVDRIIARIEDDVILESEVRELESYEQLMNGQALPREQVIQKLIEQWIVKNEATTALYPTPPEEDVQRVFERVLKRFASPETFRLKMTAASLDEAAVRRLLAEQIYLARFLDYKFRPAAQIEEQKIQDYYDKELAPQLKAKGEAVPPLDEVAEQIREVLTQQEISQRAAQWLDETKARLRIDLLPGGRS